MADYLRPTTLDDALAALADRPWTMLAGGTDVYPATVGRPPSDDILDVTGLASLREITVEDDSVRIPALATWTDLVRTDLPPGFDGLKTAARSIGGVQIQNRGTLAGNLCNASPAADGLPNLMALDARVELSSISGRREVAVGEFVVGNRRTVRRPDELATAILVPPPTPTARSTFLKLGSRAYLVISIASVAAVIDVASDGHVTSARIVVGACSEVPRRIEAVEKRIVGAIATPSLAAAIARADLAVLSPIDDVRGTAAYRRDVATTLVRRAVSELLA
ncbi:MAG: FAD binding domain-containing protein [Chloroflexota bacterium]